MIHDKVVAASGLASRLPAMLAGAHASGQPIVFSPDAGLALTRDEGFMVQEAVARGLGPIIGWKVGRKNPTALPNFAPLFQDKLYQSGSLVPRDTFRTWQIEAELVFRIDHDLPPRDQAYTRDDIARAAGAVIPGFEILDSRYAAWPDLPPPLLLADLQSHGAMVLGTQSPLPVSADFDAIPVTLTIDGEIVAQHQNGNPVGDILELTTWLANALAAKGLGLREGDLVTTGSYTGMTYLAPGQTAVASFAGLPPVEVARAA